MPPGGNEAIEPGGGAGVLSLVDVVGARVEGHRLVGEAAHRLQRRRGHDGVRLGGHLEHVAVRQPQRRRRLLAREPGAPGRRATRAVGAGPAEAGEADHVFGLARVEDDRRGSAGRRRVVRLGHGPKCRARPAHLVVADEPDPSAVAESGHAVVGRRRRQTVGHDRPDLAERPVLEARRQGEQFESRPLVGYRRDGPIALGRVRGAAMSGEERVQRAREEQSTSNGGVLQETAAIEHSQSPSVAVVVGWLGRFGRHPASNATRRALLRDDGGTKLS